MDARLSEVVGHPLLPHPSSTPGAHFVDQVIMPWLLDEGNGEQQVLFECMCKKAEARSAALADDPAFNHVKLSAPWALLGSPTADPMTWTDLIWAWFCLGDWETLVLEKKRADVEKAINSLCPEV